MRAHILVVDDEPTIRRELCELLQDEGHSAEEAESGEEALVMVEKEDFDVMITDLNMPGISGMELIEKMKRISPATHAIVLTAYGSLDSAIEALRLGAFDYILKPARLGELTAKIDHLARYRQMEAYLQLMRREVSRSPSRRKIIGKSAAMERVLRLISKVAPTAATVLITGESGTGKELVAHAIHEESDRAGEPFVAINCAAIPENLLESELFGHSKGAFTGATTRREGLLRAAGNGTVFLDEISRMPGALQAKLLRVIENREITPVGSTEVVPIGARIIAATNRDLHAEVESGRFAEDLYFRLAVVEINIPPLRERRDDIPLLVEEFLSRMGQEVRGRAVGITNDALRLLVGHYWKGNVRELENVIERAIILGESDQLAVEDLPASVQKVKPVDIDRIGGLKEATQEFERRYIESAIKASGNDKRKAAELMCISLSTLYRKLEELGMKREALS